MKTLSRCVSLLAVLMVATACVAPADPAAPVTITFYKRGYTEGGTDTTSVTNAQAVKAFEQTHPNIKVKIVGLPWTAEGTAQLETALSTHAGINVLSVNTVDLARFARAGWLAPIDPYLTGDDKADFYASGLEAAIVDGQIYAWPLWVTAVAIYANPAIFQERGVVLPTLDRPWTWDEFVAAAQQLTFQRADGTPVYGFTASAAPGAVVYLPLLYIDGGRVHSPDAKRFVQNTAEGASALQKIADLVRVHRVTPPDFGLGDQALVRSQFMSGTVAMVMDTPNFIPDMEKRGATFAALPIPMGQLGKTVTTGAFGLYGIANVSDPEQLKAANEFARYLTSSQVARDVPNYQQAPGLRRSNTGYATNANREVVAKLVSFGIYEPVASLSIELRMRWETALQAVLLGKVTAQQALDDIAPAYQAELDRNNQ
ncbi:MAG: sugar ABC transporter substrate-binding protein [Chloroflexi bacterium]|nr:sugar ABC transporter substrate-binding protein [Chloroflexota bacterium]